MDLFFFPSIVHIPSAQTIFSVVPNLDTVEYQSVASKNRKKETNKRTLSRPYWRKAHKKSCVCNATSRVPSFSSLSLWRNGSLNASIVCSASMEYESLVVEWRQKRATSEFLPYSSASSDGGPSRKEVESPTWNLRKQTPMFSCGSIMSRK